MSWRTKKVTVALRSIGRSAGLNQLIGSLSHRRGYERRFQTAMLKAIRPGDVVWDVGANVGLYSKQFAHLIGPHGTVFAYEPCPDNLTRLKEAVGKLGNIIIVAAGLGDRQHAAVFERGNDAIGATGRVIGEVLEKADNQFEIQIQTGDDLISSGAILRPNVIKIDTEGYEWHVLRGMKHTLCQQQLRMVCVEMHFASLKERKLPDAPSQIETLLGESGFSVKWTDASHIVAMRLA